MRFITSMTRCKARFGILSEFDRRPDIVCETPLLLLYTRRGSIPHLTKDVLKMVNSEQQMLSISLPNTITMAEAAKEFQSLAEFASMMEYPMFMTVQDPAEATQPGHQSKHIVSVWSRQGRHEVTAESYMDLVETFKPDIYLALCDGDTDIDSSKKRISKAVDRSHAFLDKCLARHEKSKILRDKAVLGAVEGGYSLDARERSIKIIKEKPLFGFIIDGLHKNGPDVENIQFQQIESIVQHSINLLPEDKLRVSMGCWNPAVVLSLINLGIDVFDSSYAYLATEKSKALTFLCDDCLDNELDTIFVGDKRYSTDFSPICKSCKCLTCQNHTRAYLNHLYHTKELLGSVLLMIHNTHQYIEFFKAIRHHIKNETLLDFQKKIQLKFPSKAVNL